MSEKPNSVPDVAVEGDEAKAVPVQQDHELDNAEKSANVHASTNGSENVPTDPAMSSEQTGHSTHEPEETQESRNSKEQTTLGGSSQRPSAPSSIDIDKARPQDFEGELSTDNNIPSPDMIKEVENFLVLDVDGKSRTFKSLYSGPNCSRRVLIIFVRHFFCGLCQDFLKTFSNAITPEALLGLPISTFVTVIGCGEPALIEMYRKETNCPYPIYTDPKRMLYQRLGMTRTLNLGSAPAYAQRSLMKSTLVSIVQGLKQIPKGTALQSGDSKQVGGEFLFEPLSLFTPPTTPQDELAKKKAMQSMDGASARTDQNRTSGEDHSVEEKRVTWCHRMKTTRDHSEIEELKEVLGLDLADEKKEFQRKGSGLSMARNMSTLGTGVAAA